MEAMRRKAIARDRLAYEPGAAHLGHDVSRVLAEARRRVSGAA
jgi:hypothetical protein